MEITNVKVTKTSSILNESKLKAFANITIDDCFAVNDIRIIEGDKGLFLAFPSRLKKNGDRINTAFPINSDTREKITQHVLEVYNNTQE